MPLRLESRGGGWIIFRPKTFALLILKANEFVGDTSFTKWQEPYGITADRNDTVPR
jgi:hypothetical protein